jgi:hybrid cluster-associated redox disulfide protein
MKITKKTNIKDVVTKYPETTDVFFKFGLHCLGCAAANFENIEQAAQVHGINVDKFLEELNKSIDNKKEK